MDRTSCPPLDAAGQRRIDPEAIEILETECLKQPQSKAAHVDAAGQYTPERAELHKRILAGFYQDKPCVEHEQPIAIITGGAPGSGKSFFLKKLRGFINPATAVAIDADAIRAQLPEYQGWNAGAVHEEARDMVNQMLDDIGHPCRYDLIYDGTMNRAQKYTPIFDRLRKLGYRIILIYVTVPPDVARQRVLDRYRSSGRYVERSVVEEVIAAGTQPFEQLRDMSDGWMLVDGTDGKVIERGGDPVPQDRAYAEAVNGTEYHTGLVQWLSERFGEGKGLNVPEGTRDDDMAKWGNKYGLLKRSRDVWMWADGYTHYMLTAKGRAVIEAQKQCDTCEHDAPPADVATTAEPDAIAGGLSAGMSLNDIAAKHGVHIDTLRPEFGRGLVVELEHTGDRKIAGEIALDHLVEDPLYYTKLATIETPAPSAEAAAVVPSVEDWKAGARVGAGLEGIEEDTDAAVNAVRRRLTNPDAILLEARKRLVWQQAITGNREEALRNVGEMLERIERRRDGDPQEAPMDLWEREQYALVGNNLRKLAAGVKPEDLTDGFTEPAVVVPSAGRRFTDPFTLPFDQVIPDVPRFQGRKSEYAEATVDSIMRKGWDPSGSTLKVWKDPKDGRFYLLAGYSRREAAKRLGVAELRVQEFLGDEQAAIDYAVLESNRKGQEEGLASDVDAYRRMRDGGKSPGAMLDVFKKQAKVDRLEALSHLDNRGRFMEMLAGDAGQSFTFLERNAQWIGQLRSVYPQLTNAHEREIFDFIYLEGGNRLTKDALFKRIEGKISRIDFDPEQPLNFAGGVSTSAYTDPAREEVARLRLELERTERTLRTKRESLAEAKSRGLADAAARLEQQVNDQQKIALRLNEEIVAWQQRIARAERELPADLFSQKVEELAALPVEMIEHRIEEREVAKVKPPNLTKARRAKLRVAFREQARSAVDGVAAGDEATKHELLLSAALKIQVQRRYWGVVDEHRDNARRLAITRKNLLMWARDPGRYDMVGVDNWRKRKLTAGERPAKSKAPGPAEHPAMPAGTPSYMPDRETRRSIREAKTAARYAARLQRGEKTVRFY